MKIAVKWKKKNNGERTSPDGYVIVRKERKGWRMVDQIDQVEGIYSTQTKALDAGAKQRMISEMGSFNVFIKTGEKEGDLVFNHLYI